MRFTKKQSIAFSIAMGAIWTVFAATVDMEGARWIGENGEEEMTWRNRSARLPSNDLPDPAYRGFEIIA